MGGTGAAGDETLPAEAEPTWPADAAPMSTADVNRFETERSRLTGIAYRMLGSMADAEDAVQEGWFRWQRLGADGRRAVVNPAAWCTTAVSRLALDRLKSAQRQREEYVGPWLPEPVLTSPDPADSAELAESLTLGFLTVLERLGPVERAAFLLVDVFGESYAVVAEVVGRSEDACRQVVSRARRRVRDERRGDVAEHVRPADETSVLVRAFLAACADGDVEALRRVLADDVVIVSDGGALVHAARHPVIGFERVARFLINLTRRVPADVVSDLRPVNGEPGMVVWRDGIATLVMVCEVRSGRISTVRMVVNPDKLHAISG